MDRDPTHKQINEFRKSGYSVLNGAISPEDIADFRGRVHTYVSQMPNTRKAPHSRHLAGFHRFPAIKEIHDELAANDIVQSFMQKLYKGDHFATIGLSDITVNRSQQWHTDLLRGAYRKSLDDVDIWSIDAKPCVKVLVYLQSRKSLRIIPGSHMAESPLDDSKLEKEPYLKSAIQLDVSAGDLVLLDIRCVHRGSTDSEMADISLADNPKILISTVFGIKGDDFAEAMKLGNQLRMRDWDQRHLAGRI